LIDRNDIGSQLMNSSSLHREQCTGCPYRKGSERTICPLDALCGEEGDKKKDHERYAAKRHPILIGDIDVSRDGAIFETLLGSCVTVCLWDAQLALGGMNHFVIPKHSKSAPSDGYCGERSIPLLVAKMQELGGHIDRMVAKVFGGGSTVKELSDKFDVGSQNVAQAHEALEHIGIPIVAHSTGGNLPCRVRFHTDTGRAFVRRVVSADG
jgi:chemotaxis protein CheD